MAVLYYTEGAFHVVDTQGGIVWPFVTLVWPIDSASPLRGPKPFSVSNPLPYEANRGLVLARILLRSG